MLARADFASGHDVRFCWDCKTELDKKRVPIAVLMCTLCCSTATFTQLAAAGVVVDGLSNLRRPGALKNHLDLRELTELTDLVS